MSTNNVTNANSLPFACQKSGHFWLIPLSDRLSPPLCQRCSSPLIPIPSRGGNYSPSYLSVWERCPRYAYYQDELLLKPAMADRTAMDAGTLWHHMMFTWRTTKETVISKKLDEAVAAMVTLAKEEMPDHPATKRESDIRSIEGIIEAFVRYAEYYTKIGEKISVARDVNGEPFAEIPFVIFAESGVIVREDEVIEDIDLFPSHPPVLRGILDLICTYEGELYILDYKTTAILNNAYMQKFRTSHQMTAYIHAARSLGFPVRGAIIDVVGWFKHIVPEKHFLRTITTRTPLQCEQYIEQVKRRDAQITEARKTGEWDQRTESCASWNRPCEFMEPCLAWGTEMHGKLLQGGYMVRMDRIEKRNEETKTTID